MVLKSLKKYSLPGKEINNTDYEHALKVWNALEIKTMKDNHDLYLKFDVLLLADVFETFRNNTTSLKLGCKSHYDKS